MNNYSQQIEMEFLWPHRGVQLELDLDRPEPKHTVDTVPYTFSTGYRSEWGTTATTAINSASLEINITDSVGNLKIGGMSVGLKESPKWYQRIFYKLLGFNWSEK
jgi:hypothetical protein